MPFPPAATAPEAEAHPPAAEAHWPSRAALAEPATEPVIICSNGKMPHEEGAWKNGRDTVAQSHQLLERRVAERTAELLASNGRLQAEIAERRRAEEALREADRHKDEFLATLAHELRNPLAPIRNSVEVLQRLELKEPKLDRVRTAIDRQVRQLTRLVDDLLDVSRISRGKISLQKAPIELTMIVERALETSRPVIEARRHHLSVDLPAEPVCLEGISRASRKPSAICSIMPPSTRRKVGASGSWRSGPRVTWSYECTTPERGSPWRPCPMSSTSSPKATVPSTARKGA
jgi:hypothetical protein